MPEESTSTPTRPPRRKLFQLRQRVLKVWNSPTATSWAMQISSMSRLLVVTPLILTRFDKVEIACWFLFGSLNIFGNLVANRLGVAFSRMIAFACSGARDLSPILKAGERRGDGIPHWPLVFETYGTLGSLQAALGLAAGLAAWGMGHFGLSNLLEGYASPGEIEAAFAVFVVSTSISFAYQKYAVTLIGLNMLAVTNRIDAIFSLLSIGAGVLTLTMGGGIFMLAVVMQSFSLLSILRNRWLLLRFESGSFRGVPSFAWNRQIMEWAWEPTWKSMAGKLANTGLIQASGIIFARYGTPSEVASFLLANRLLTIAVGLAVAPFFSRIPVFARWLSEGQTERLQKEVLRRISTASILLAAAILAGAVFVNPLLHLIKSNIPFLPQDLWLAIGTGMLIVNFGQLNASATSIGNHVILYKEQFLTSFFCVGLMIFLTPRFGLWGLLAGMYVPLVGFLTIQSVVVGARYLSLNPWVFFRRSFLPVFGVFSVLAAVLVWCHR